MPLSEHEQRMLEQIESALYAEDPKFASQVRTGHMRGVSNRRRTQAIALFALGLVLLFAGMFLSMAVQTILMVVSLLGFALMFGAGVMLLRGSKAPAQSEEPRGNAPSGVRHIGGHHGSRQSRKQSGFSSRMEDRFRRRFDQP